MYTFLRAHKTRRTKKKTHTLMLAIFIYFNCFRVLAGNIRVGRCQSVVLDNSLNEPLVTSGDADYADERILLTKRCGLALA